MTTTIGIITGDMQEKKTGMGTYMSHLLRGISGIALVSQIHHRDGDLVPGCTSVQPWYPPMPYWYLSWSGAVTFSQNMGTYDIIHNIGQYPILISKEKKNIITVHDLIPNLYPSYVTPLYSLQSRLILPKILQNASGIITVSESTKQDIITHFSIPADKIYTVYHGVSEHFSPRSPVECARVIERYSLNNPFILFVGALEPKKNIPTLIKAFALCLRQEPSLELVIAGKRFWKFEEIFSIIQELHLEKKVRILDFVPYDDLPLLYSAAKLFVFPSLYEGFGLPPLEAMKCGTPVIVSNRSSLPEIVGPDGMQVDPLDQAGLAGMILRVLQNQDLCAAQAAYSLRRSALFTWENCVNRTREVYESVLNPS